MSFLDCTEQSIKIEIDARLLFRDKPSPHIALFQTLLQENLFSPYPWTFVLYTDNHSVAKEETQAENVIVRQIERSSRFKNELVWFNFELARALERDKINLFLSCYYRIPVWTSIPCLNMIHDLSFFVVPSHMVIPRYKSRIRRWMLFLMLRLHCQKATKTLTVSNYSKTCLSHILGLDENNILVFSNGIELKRFASASFSPSAIEQCEKKVRCSGKYILFLGSNIPKKNVTGLISAYAGLDSEIRQRHPLVLRTSQGREVALIKKLGIESDVIFIEEYISEEEKAALISRARTLVLVSYNEGFGIPVIEAMAAGIPPIVSDSSALAEIAGDAGIKVNPAVQSEITSALQRVLLALAEDYSRWSELCKERAKSFSSKAVATRLASVIQELLDEK
jgi:glycosyltransferase involved in cell wall biosynthesis